MSARPKIRSGANGMVVRDLQQLLNTALKPKSPLAVDGAFGPRTLEAVLRYQREKWLEDDGIVGDATWAALEGRERYAMLDTTCQLVPQWTDATCWSASTAMLLGVPFCAGPGGAPLGQGGGLANDSDRNDLQNTSTFARAHGLTMLPGQSWTPNGIADLLRAHKRIMINTLWDAGSYARGVGSSGHMRIIAGIRGDGTAEGTTIRIFDPWPPHKGAVYSKTYGPFIRRYPTTTYQIFFR